jgi:hypothetical protein
MAKALFGHIGVAPDRRLADELIFLRTRVRALEGEVDRLRAERDASLPVDDMSEPLAKEALDERLQDLSELSEPALA